MEILNLSTKELSNIVNNNETIGCGSYGIIFKLDGNTLFKFKYKDFIEEFEKEGRIINLKKLKNVSKKIKILKDVYNGEDPTENIKNIIKLQNKIKLTKLTKGLVLVNDFCVGYLLHYHKNMENLYDYLIKNDLSLDVRKNIYNKIEKAVKELYYNNIFVCDLTTRNILFNPKTNEIQLIDFEDAFTRYTVDFVDNNLDAVKEKLENLKDFLLQEETNEKSM